MARWAWRVPSRARSETALLRDSRPIACATSARRSQQYDEHFWRNGHSVRMIVFDDSSPADQEKYYPLLEQTRTHNDVYYVGPREKEQFLALPQPAAARQEARARSSRTCSARATAATATSRSCTRWADSWSAPTTTCGRSRSMEDSPESLGGRRGEPRAPAQGRARTATRESRSTSSPRSSTCSASRSPTFPRTTSAASCSSTPRWTWRPTRPRALARENSLLLQARAASPDDAVVKMAQTFRSGTNDIDAIDYVDMFLADEEQTEPRRAERRLRAGQLPPGADQARTGAWTAASPATTTPFGLPPFFPTRLRFEDYIYRLWVQQDGVVAAARRCRAEPHQEQLHAQPAGRRDLQRGGGQPAQAEDQGDASRASTSSASPSTTTAR